IAGDGAVIDRLVAFEDSRARGGLHAFGAEQILDPERHTGKRFQVSGGAGRIGGAGRGKRMVGSLDDIGVERPPLLDRADPGLGGLAGRKVARLHAVTERRDAKLGQIGHSITLGTAKKPCSATGALASTSSRRSPEV